MSSRDPILSRLRKQQAPSPIPEYRFDEHFVDHQKQFSEMLTAVGGTCISVPHVNALKDELQRLDAHVTAKKILSIVSGVDGTIQMDKIRDPHQLQDLELAILPGVFGVAENAAVWLDMSCMGPHRAVFVIPQHLVLVLNAAQIVATMHDAFERVNLAAHDFGVFISGPSKTADIEQSLVIGAHGARSCTVFLINDQV